MHTRDLTSYEIWDIAACHCSDIDYAGEDLAEDFAECMGSTSENDNYNLEKSKYYFITIPEIINIIDDAYRLGFDRGSEVE